MQDRVWLPRQLLGTPRHGQQLQDADRQSLGKKRRTHRWRPQDQVGQGEY